MTVGGTCTWFLTVCLFVVCGTEADMELDSLNVDSIGVGAGLPKDFVYLSSVDSTIVQEMRYAGYHHFVGHPVNGYLAAQCILTLEAALALSRVQSYLRQLPTPYTLKVYDCYRPVRAVQHFVAWARNLTDTLMKGEFYPTEDKSQLFADGYISARSSHSRGSTMDLTIVPWPVPYEPPYVPGQPLKPCFSPLDQGRFPDNSIDCGTGFDCFSPIAWTNSTDPHVGPLQASNRLLLYRAMLDYGAFINLPVEWWHFTLANEPFPDTYFDFPVQ